MTARRPVILNSGILSQLLAADFVDPGAGVQFPNGSAAAPSAAFNTSYGLFYDTANTALGIAVAGSEVAFIAANWMMFSSTTVQLISSTAVSAALGLSAGFNAQKFSPNAAGPGAIYAKGRGNLAGPAVPVKGDMLGSFAFAGWGAASTFVSAAQINALLIETGTVGPSAMGGQLIFQTTPIGSGALAEVMRLDNQAGLSMFGANPVIDANRLLLLANYASGSLPAAPATGATAYNSSAGAPAWFNGTSWINVRPPPLVFASGAPSTVANTTAETAFLPFYTIPANSLQVGTVIKIKIYGVYSTAAVAPNFTGRLRLAGNTALTIGPISTLLGSTSNDGWTVEALFIVTAIGASGTIEAQGFAEFDTAMTSGLMVNLVNTAALAINTTAVIAINATAQWGTANASNSMTARQMIVEILNP